jgi:vacuolar-type H+-ATPase subunit I/STV1
MTDTTQRKCSYYNSGYCKFTRKENGCRYLHPTECCINAKCKDKLCPLNHPKKCRHGDHCRYQTKCMYKHVTDKVNNIAKLTEMDEKETNQLTEEIKMLKAEIEKLKEENIEKINELTKLHLLERNGLQNETITLKHTIDDKNVIK